MPNRILREGILTSQSIARLGWAEEVFYRRLHSVVDDYGRYYADVGMLRAACYPRQLNKVSDSDVGKWLRSCADAGLVRVYPAEDGESYLEVTKFGQQVRAKKSKFPDPPDICVADAKQVIANAPVFVDVFVDVDEGVKARKRAPRPQLVSMPEGFDVSERVRHWAAEKGFDRLPEHMEAFRRKVASKGYQYADWDAAFMEAVREDWAKLRGRLPTGQPIPPRAGPGDAEKTRELIDRMATPLSPEEKAKADEARKLAMSGVRRVA